MTTYTMHTINCIREHNDIFRVLHVQIQLMNKKIREQKQQMQLVKQWIVKRTVSRWHNHEINWHEIQNI